MKPLFLLVNDDGIHSPGLKAAAEAVADLGELLIVAPHVQQTGMGRAFPRTPETGIIDEVELEICGKPVLAYAVHGSPAYAAAHGVLELAERKPDLCISGINYGENLGTIPTCSGTLGAAFEANTHEVPAIAVSLQADLKIQHSNDFGHQDWSVAQRHLRYWTKQVMEKGMPGQADTLNINVPAHPDDPEKFYLARQSRQNYFCFQPPGPRDRSKRFELKSKLWVDEDTLEPDSDVFAAYKKNITAVAPLTIDMTAGGQSFGEYSIQG